MDFGKLFSFEGRVSRGTFWGTALLNLFPTVIAWLVVASGQNAFLTLLFLVVLVASLVVGLANQVKRWHDRDKSWAWIFIAFIPFIGGIWAFVETGCLAGTDGDNQYGSENSGSPFAGEQRTVYSTAGLPPGRDWGR